MRPLWIFVHGWGFDASFWDALLAAPPLAEEEVVRIELGFRGTATLEPEAALAGALQGLGAGRPLVGVGHSLGFAWLLRSGRAFDALVSVNGFPRFLRGDGFPGVHPRLLARMRAKLPEDPAGVAGDFLRRCGLRGPLPAEVDGARLAAGLDWLASWDLREALAAHRGPLRALAGREDPIVPPPMSEAAFAGPGLSWVEDGGHLLPATHPDLCAAEIAAVGEALR